MTDGDGGTDVWTDGQTEDDDSDDDGDDDDEARRGTTGHNGTDGERISICI